MAFDSYSDLKIAIASWLVRDDLTTQIPDFVALAESKINRDLRVREMITTATGTVTDSALAIPDDYIEALMFVLDTANDLPLEYRPISDSQFRVAGSTSGQPRWFSVVGDEFRFFPSPDGEYTYTLDYYAKVPALSSTNTTTWLLAKAPDLYLFAALAEAYAYLLEEDRQAYWENRYQAAKAALQFVDQRSKRTDAPHRARVLA